MYPVVISRVANGLGPYLGRIATRDKTLLPRLLEKLRAGGRFVGSKIGDVVNFAKQSPANAMLALTTLASLGYSASELLDSNDPEVVEFANQLSGIAMKAAGIIDETGAKSEALAGKVGTSEEDDVKFETARQALAWARSFFGSEQRAIEGHRMLQAFVEMPLAEVTRGFARYKL